MVKLAIGSVGDSLSTASLKSYLAEFIATLLFVFAGVGSAIAYGNISKFLSCSYTFFLQSFLTKHTHTLMT